MKKSLKKIVMKEMIGGLFHLDFLTQYELTATFARLHASYENPRFRHKVFSLEEFADWWAQERGNFTYYSDYLGFNLPSKVLPPFYNGKFDPLSEKEKRFLDLFERRSAREEDFYVIGTFENRQDDLKHETAHGLYYLDTDYHKGAEEILDGISFKKMDKFLGRRCYHRAVWRDEAQAYLIDGYDKKGYKRAQKKLERLFDKRLKEQRKK